MLTSRAITTLLNALRRVERELLMADVIYDIESLLSDMSDEEQAILYPGTASRRAPNFATYQMLINSLGVGAKKNLGLPKNAPDPEKAARDMRYNLNEAAKERTEWQVRELTEDEAAQFAANKKIDRFERADGTVVTRMKDGKWMTEAKAPVILRWKVDTQEVERSETKDGKTTTKKVKVPTSLHFVIVATEAVKHRAPRAKKDETNNPNAGSETPASGTPITPAEGEAPKVDTPTTNGAVTEDVPAAA